MTQALSVLDPNLKEVVNMSMSKKDLMDMMESEILEELEAVRDMLNAKSKKITDARKAVNDKQIEFFTSCVKKKAEEFKSVGKGVISALKGLDCVEVYSASICGTRYADGGRQRDSDIVGASVRLSYNLTHRTNTDGESANFTFTRTYVKQMTSSEVKRYKAFQAKLKDLYLELKEISDSVNANANDIKDLPKRMRKVGSKLSRKALQSSKKGKEVLKLMDQLRGQ